MLTTKAVRQGHTLKVHVPAEIRAHMRLTAGDVLVWTPLRGGGAMLSNARALLDRTIAQQAEQCESTQSPSS